MRMPGHKMSAQGTRLGSAKHSSNNEPDERCVVRIVNSSVE